jgi:glycolate dehydrogenase iron-sulfur subunit
MSEPVTTPGKSIDYELFLDCVHCGLCTAACPTFVELGTEMDSPRGRIYLMRAVTDGRVPLDQEVRRHLDLCLDCRACETACPSGVQYGKLIEPFRADLQKLAEVQGEPATPLPWWQRWVLFHIFPDARRTRLALFPVKLLQATGIDWLVRKTGLLKLLPRRMRQMHELLPRLRWRREPIPEFLRAIGKRRASVALFTGCVNDAIFHHVNWCTAKVLQANGCDVWTPRNQVCCGALHYHSGQEAPAIELAKQNCRAFESSIDPLGSSAAVGGRSSGRAASPEEPARREPRPPQCLDAIIMNVAGCGSMRHEIGHLLAKTGFAEQGRAFAGKLRDISEFLVELGPVPPTHPLNLRATYHDACHLCHAQQIRKQPRQLLEMIPGLELVPLNESEICCGAAGSYNVSQPEMAERLGERKVKNVLAALRALTLPARQETLPTRRQAVFTANAGCLLQIAKHLRTESPDVWVAHPIEALWAGYGGR